ncbi:MAG: phenylacetate--CoA ligase family protein [Deltaproteobacteria bacterium]|nr:phenylacetate--CoA ligase family protein [Deltaproteobacteria bacterium]
MKPARKLNEFLVGNLLFPATSNLFNRKKILSNYRAFRKSEWYSPERLAEIQTDSLKRLVDYAYNWIPFYRTRFDDIGMKPGDIRTLEDISSIPPVTRQDVIEHHHLMVDKRFVKSALFADQGSRKAGAPIPFAPLRKNRLVRNTSSGSTGAPTVFYEDGSRTAMNWAHELRFRNWFDIGPGTREARFARLSTDFMPNSRDFLFRKYFWNQLVLPGLNLAEEDYDICHRSLMEYRPGVFWGSTSALIGFARYVKDHEIDFAPYRPELIITWAAPMYEHEEALMREVFQCHVTNIYGAREVGHIACRCPEGSYHINQEVLLVEQEEIMSDGHGAGEILVTTLDTTIMPFIRYRMGDIGRVSRDRDKCSCGRTLQTLENLLGRTGEVFTTKDGRMISLIFWCDAFMNPALSEKIVRFQVIYKANDDIRIILVKGNGFKQDTENELYRFLRDNFSEDIKISFQYADEIKPRISGKYQMVVNEMETRS